MKKLLFLLVLVALLFTTIPAQAYTNGPTWLYARLKHDNPPRQVLPNAPETVTLTEAPRGAGKGPAIPINLAWQNFDAALNTPAAFKWLLTPSAALVNTGWSATRDPKAESIGFGGNVIVIDYITGHYGHVRSFDYSETPPSPDVINYENYPMYVQKITTISRHSGTIGNPGAGLDVYYMLLHKTDLWIDLNKVEFFPPLTSVRPREYISLRVRSGPSTAYEVIDGLYSYQTAQLLNYVPRGSNVWAYVQLQNGTYGYIALLFNNAEYTTWHMSTVPPVTPK